MNPGDDSDPNHWDIALLVSGVDFWGPDGRGGRSYVTMGLATVTGICSKTYGCVIGEMGVSGSGSGGLDDMVMWSIERVLVTGDPHLVVNGLIGECI